MAEGGVKPGVPVRLGERLEKDVPEVGVPGFEVCAVCFWERSPVPIDPGEHGLAVAVEPVQIGQANGQAFEGVGVPGPFLGVRQLLL